MGNQSIFGRDTMVFLFNRYPTPLIYTRPRHVFTAHGHAFTPIAHHGPTGIHSSRRRAFTPIAHRGPLLITLRITCWGQSSFHGSPPMSTIVRSPDIGSRHHQSSVGRSWRWLAESSTLQSRRHARRGARTTRRRGTEADRGPVGAAAGRPWGQAAHTIPITVHTASIL